MRPDWSLLQPDQPLQGFERAYVPRLVGGDRLAVLVRAGLCPMALTGPHGCGKTTELNRARVVLAAEGMRVFGFDLAQLWDGPDLDGKRALYGLAVGLVDRTVDMEPGFEPPQALIDDLRASDPTFPRGHGKVRPPLDLLEEAIGEVCRFYGKDRLALFVDGLDEVEPRLGRELLTWLDRAARLADLVVVLSPTLAHGPDNQPVLRRFRLFPVPVPPVLDLMELDGSQGRDFLTRVALGRLEIEDPTPALLQVLDRMARRSGGLPRTFLRLLRDAGLYAGIESRPLPAPRHVREALRDAVLTMQRLLEAGDIEALDKARGTAGLGIEADRRVRFLAHALLVEHASGEDTVVLPHPLLERLIAQETGAGWEE